MKGGLIGSSGLVVGAVLFAALAVVRPAKIGSVQRGVDVCAACGMTIEEPQYAGARVMASGKVRLYDDLGCMLDELREQPGGVCYVQDCRGGGWVDGGKAWYELNARFRTPMGSGIVAFREKPNGGAMDFDAVSAARHAWMKAKYGGR